MITTDQRQRFDDLLDQIVADLPDELHDLLEEVPLIVEDEPSRELLHSMDIDPRTTELFGLHWGVALTNRSVEHGSRLPDTISLFRGPILRHHGRSDRRLARQIHITLLHEIGHHFGLDEDDLAALGYG